MVRVDWKRREFLGALGVALCTGMENSDAAQGSQAATDGKKQRIIRTVLKDLAPHDLTTATLMHEHLGTGRRRVAPPKMPVGWKWN